MEDSIFSTRSHELTTVLRLFGLAISLERSWYRSVWLTHFGACDMLASQEQDSRILLQTGLGIASNYQAETIESERFNGVKRNGG